MGILDTLGDFQMANNNKNYSRIFKLIYEQDTISKQEIALQLNLSLPTVSQNLKALLEDNLIRNDGKFKSQIGRRAVAYSVNSENHISLGLELFKEYVSITAVDLKNQEIAFDRRSISFDLNDNYFAELTDWIKAFSQKNGLTDDQIIGMGVGIQGLISFDRKTVLYGKILNCTGLQVSQFEKYLPYPVSFFHDADCVAYAEQDSSDSNEDTIYLSLGEHLGTAIMIDGKIYSGEQGRSGTMEHVTFDLNSDRVCYCGRKGCVETYVSISSLLNDGESITDFMDQLKTDKDVQKRWNEYLDYLAEAVNNFHMFLDNRIVLAGELLQFVDDSVLFDVKDRIHQITAFPEDDPYLSFGTVLSHPVASGAALPLMESFVDSI